MHNNWLSSGKTGSFAVTFRHLAVSVPTRFCHVASRTPVVGKVLEGPLFECPHHSAIIIKSQYSLIIYSCFRTVGVGVGMDMLPPTNC